jgi:prepilin-type N-terminal cleavage/methylation domain-containing protein
MQNKSNIWGFTLIEVLLAIVVFSLIASVMYTALGPAGEGFAMLKDYRVRLEQQQWIGKQLRRDVSYLSHSADKNLPMIRLMNDSRGSDDFDELHLLIRDPMYPGLTLVRYYVDEESGQLKREAISPWARTHVEPISWALADVESFAVEAADPKSGFKQTMNQQKPFTAPTPTAIKVTVRDSQGEMEWDLPVLIK